MDTFLTVVIVLLVVALVWVMFVNYTQSIMIDGLMKSIAETGAQVEEVFSKVIAYEKKYGKIDTGTESGGAAGGEGICR